MKKLIYLFSLVAFMSSLLHAAVLDVRVNASADDAIEEISSGNLYSNEGQLDLVVYTYSNSNSDTPQKVGLRFVNITVPAGSTINNAYLEFQANQDNAGQTDITIVGESNTNPSTYDTGLNGDITSRSETTASVDWLSVPAWIDGQTYQTVDITAIIQELVDAAGWQSGNAMALMLKPFDANCNTGECLRQAVSFDGNSATAPLLHIVYNLPPTPPMMGIVPDITAHVDINSSFDLSAYVTPTDGDPILSYDLNDSVPDGLSFDNATGIISGMPRFTGATTLSLTATDKDGTSNAATFTITVLDALVAEYRLDECFWLGSAYSDVKDHTFNALNGSAYNNAAIDLTNAHINYSGLFDGVADHVEILHDARLDVTNQLTVSFWVYPTDNTKDQTFVRKQWEVFYNQRNNKTNRIQFKLRINNKNKNLVFNEPANWLNQWHFIAASYDGSTMKLYIDEGTPSKTKSQTGDIDPNTVALTIGGKINSRHFAGNIDEVKIWNSTLSDTEIATIFANESAGKNYNGTSRDPITCNATIQAGTWEMIGIPAETRNAGIGVQDVFGDDFVGANYDAGAVDGWVLWKNTYPLTDNYNNWVKVDYVNNEAIELGAGYFLGSTLDVTWDVDGLESVNYDSSYNGTSDCMAKRCVEVPLVSLGSDGTDGSGTIRYNLGGFIGKSPVDWKDCRFIVSNTNGSNVEVLTPTEAETAGYASRTISLWMGGLGSGTGGQVLSGDYTDCTDNSPGGCQLIPYHGAWIELHAASLNKTVKLLVPEE
jgi:hypothetical protein